MKTLFQKYAVIGNDTPFAPVYPSSVGAPGVPQRHKDIRKAKELLMGSKVDDEAGAGEFCGAVEVEDAESFA